VAARAKRVDTKEKGRPSSVNVTCNKCGKKYVISDEKVAGKTSVKIRCKQCQNLIAVAVTVGANGGGANGQGAYAGAQSGAYAATASGTFTSAPSGTLSSSPSGAVSVGSRQQDWESERPPAPPLEATWHAMIAGKQQGPFDQNTVARKIAAGEVTLRTYLWKPGMGDWKRAADVPEVSQLFASASAGATATGQVQAPTSSTRTPALHRDVAVANEVPSPELTRKKTTTAVYGAQEAKAAIAAAQAAGAEAEAEEAKKKKAAPLNDLFSDLNPSSALNDQEHPAADASHSAEAPVSDPFAQLAPPVKEGEAPPPGEATKFFIAKAGVNKRNPPWKIALFVLSGVGVPVALGWVLTTFHIVNLPTVTTTNDDGQEVQEPFFSTGGISGLKDALTGDAKRKKQEAERLRKQKEAALAAAGRPRPIAGTTTPDKEPDDEPVPVPKAQNPDLAALYGEGAVGNTKIGKRKGDDDTKPALETGGAGLSRDVANKIIADKMKAFQLCVETAVHRNPKLAVGKITINLTVGASGAVKATSIDPRKWEGADWALCMASAGKRITFPKSEGETELQVPITVGIAMGP
jgi:hypothetical protein